MGASEFDMDHDAGKSVLGERGNKNIINVFSMRDSNRSINDVPTTDHQENKKEAWVTI